MLGTPYYIAPEMLLGEKHNFASDIWSLGVILYEVTALQPPFMGKTYASLAMKIVNCDKHYEPPKNASDGLRKMLDDILKKDPAKRPSINQILGFDILA